MANAGTPRELREPRVIDVAAVIDRERVGALQFFVMALCTLLVILDGFDLQIIAFTTPAIAKEWNIAPAAFGPVFAAGLVGMILGTFVFGPLGDRRGRKPMIVVSVTIFGLFSLLTAYAQGYTQLLSLRLLTGIGLGGALPNAAALIAEYAPARWRPVMVSMIFLGIPLGGLLGGGLAASLLPTLGWRALYVLGGVLPLMLVPVLAAMLPESIRFLAARGDRGARVAGILARIHAAGGYSAADRFSLPESPRRGFPVRHLFTEGRARDTLLLWIMFFLNLTVVYYLINWIPSLLVDAGFSVQKGALAAVALNLGGAVGCAVVGYLMRRYGTRRLIAASFLAGSVCVVAIGQGGGAFAFIMVMTFLGGLLTFGAMVGMIALAAALYTTEMRATGVGWAFGVGRIGSIVGAVMGGVLLALAWGMPRYFLFFGVLLLIAAVALSAMRFDDRPGRARASSI